jgi:hypothetical protein
VFVSVPAIDLTPLVMQGGAANQALVRTSLEQWNKNVQSVAAALKVFDDFCIACLLLTIIVMR